MGIWVMGSGRGRGFVFECTMALYSRARSPTLAYRHIDVSTYEQRPSRPCMSKAAQPNNCQSNGQSLALPTEVEGGEVGRWGGGEMG